MKKKKNLWKHFLSAALGALMGVSMVACGGSEDGEGSHGMVTVDFMYTGDLSRIEAFKLMVDEFNSTVGPELGVKVKGIPKTASTTDVLAQQQRLRCVYRPG